MMGEGVQKWKIPLMEYFEKGRTICDLGSGITMPYKEALSKREPRRITFVDTRFSNNLKFHGMIWSSEDIFVHLRKMIDRDVRYAYIWASEIIEHIPPDRQKELFDLIDTASVYHIITFPTVDHFNFHNDWTHRPVCLQHTRSCINGKDWEGIITNILDVNLYLEETYETYTVFKPKMMISKKRAEKGLEM